jgi:hypothetical protein
MADLEYGANIFASRMGAYATARRYMGEGVTSMVYPHEKGWAVEIVAGGMPGPLDMQMIAAFANRGARVFAGKELTPSEVEAKRLRDYGVGIEFGAPKETEFSSDANDMLCHEFNEVLEHVGMIEDDLGVSRRLPKHIYESRSDPNGPDKEFLELFDHMEAARGLAKKIGDQMHEASGLLKCTGTRNMRDFRDRNR